MNADESIAMDSLENLKHFRICLCDDVQSDLVMKEMSHYFNLANSSVTVDEVDKNSDDIISVLVTSLIEDDVKSNVTNNRIVGPTALIELAQKKESDLYYRTLFNNLSKPLYCHAMTSVVVYFAGFRNPDTEKLKSMKSQINCMGGRVRKEADSNITHMVAKDCLSKKILYATLFNVPIISEKWIDDAWNNRDTVGFRATDTDFMLKYKLRIFEGFKVAFLGFSDEDEKNHMIEILRENGGEPVEDSDPNCTHVVIDDTKISTLSQKSYRKKVYLVRAEWFWSSIQFEGRKNELDFKLDDSQANHSNATPGSVASVASIFSTSSSKSRKRKLYKEKFSFGGDSPQSGQKRRSSVADITRHSECSLLDDSSITSPISKDAKDSVVPESVKTTSRFLKFMELWQTETNYVGILRTIMTIFKCELEAMVDKPEQLLNATELKIIFGHLPPLYETHCKMLEDLSLLAEKWSEDYSVGNIILKYSQDLVKAYPPFINFFENTRDMLINCDKSKPRFHAFLKLRQSRPECGRQSLQELLIRPVQRLPSVNLLLNELLKSTPKNNADFNKLEKAIEEIQRVMTYINEDKKRTEGQVALFDIFNEIENCPADLVSSHRCFIGKCEVTSRGGDVGPKGKPLVLFLFSDMIEVCKSKFKTSSKENVTTNPKHANAKLYKHVTVIGLTNIIKVLDIKDSDDITNNFALVVKNYHSKDSEGLLLFSISDNSINKSNYLRALSTQIANIFCTPDIESYLMEIEAGQLEGDSNESSSGALTKALNLASETRKKVSRAFSFTSKTPNKLKRAMSTMMSPFGNQNALTPSSQLANLQLALPPPSSVDNHPNFSGTPTPCRRNKSSSFTMSGSLRRL